MYSFGSGVLLGTRTDIANATPLNFGLVQEVTIDESATIKELTGQFQRPVAIARGTIKTTGKAKVARISGMAFANLYYGVVPTAGQVATSFAEADTVAADNAVYGYRCSMPRLSSAMRACSMRRPASAYAGRVGPRGRAIFSCGRRVYVQFSGRRQGRLGELHLHGGWRGSKIHGGQSTSRDDADLPGGFLHDISRPGHFVEAQ